MYEVLKMTDDIYAFNEETRARSFLVVGTEKALKIDTGIGWTDFATELPKITDKPIVLVNTHADMDHIGHNELFEERYIHQADYEKLKANRMGGGPGGHGPGGPGGKPMGGPGPEGGRPPMGGPQGQGGHGPGGPDERPMGAGSEGKPGERPMGGPQEVKEFTEKYNFVEDGDKFDIGGYVFEVIHVGGHSKGSIMLYEREKKILFVGDILTSENTFAFNPSINKQEVKQALEKMMALDLDVEVTYTFHNDNPIYNYKELLADSYAAMCNYLDGKPEDDVFEMHLGPNVMKIKRYKYGCASILVERVEE